MARYRTVGRYGCCALGIAACAIAMGCAGPRTQAGHEVMLADFDLERFEMERAQLDSGAVPAPTGVPEGGFAVVADKDGKYHIIYRLERTFHRIEASRAKDNGGGPALLRWK